MKSSDKREGEAECGMQKAEGRNRKQKAESRMQKSGWRMQIGESRMGITESRMENAESWSLFQEEHFPRHYFRDAGLAIQRARFKPVEVDSACKRAGFEPCFIQSRVEFS